MGTRFWIRLVALLIAGAIAVWILFYAVGYAIVSWGFLGALLLLVCVALLAGWLIDRRTPPRMDRI